MPMSITCTVVLLSLRALLRLDILAWIVGLSLLIGALILLYFQYRKYRSLQGELEMLSKVKLHSVEYDLVLRAMKLLVWRLDVETHIVTFESDYRDSIDNVDFQTGVKAGDVIKMLVPEYAKIIKDGINDLLASRIEVFHTQYQMRNPLNNTTYWGEGFATVDKRDLEGKPLSLVGTVMRIDQQKEIENVLMDAVYHAEESDRLKSAFLNNISHEIRTPLNAIVGFSEVLMEVDDLEERQRLMKLIRQNNTHMLRIFDDIVSMSKLEARGGGDVQESTFELSGIFKEIIDKYKVQAEETGVSLEIIDEDNLPILTTDRNRVREIVNQYMHNAIKFTPSGKISLGCDVYDDKVRIYVRDTGIGIPEDKCNDRLFERFVKVDEFVAGTGLGLSICRGLAMTLKGEVGMESTEGKGSVFWFKLNK